MYTHKTEDSFKLNKQDLADYTSRLIKHADEKANLYSRSELEKIANKSQLHSDILKHILGLSHLDRFGAILTHIKGDDILNSNPIHVARIASYLAKKEFFNGLRPHCAGLEDSFCLIIDPATLRHYKKNPETFLKDIQAGDSGDIKITIPLGLFYCSPFSKDSIDQLEDKVDKIVETYDQKLSLEENLMRPIKLELIELFKQAGIDNTLLESNVTVVTNSLSSIDEVCTSNFEENPALESLLNNSGQEIQDIQQYLDENSRILSTKDITQIIDNLIAEVSLISGYNRDNLGLFIPNPNKSYGMLAWIASQELGLELDQFIFNPNEHNSKHKTICIFDDFIGSGVSLYEEANYFLGDSHSKVYICPLVTAHTKKKRYYFELLKKDPRIEILEGISVNAADNLGESFKKISGDPGKWNQFRLNTAVAFPWGAPDNCSKLWGTLKLWMPRNLKPKNSLPIIQDDDF